VKLATKLFAACLLCFAPYVAQSTEYISNDIAVVRVMNKAAGRARTLRIPVGQPTEFEKLEILVRACKSTSPFAAQDSFMFAEIFKRASVGDNAPRIFSGWMIASEPGENPLQDPEYDLWLTECE